MPSNLLDFLSYSSPKNETINKMNVMANIHMQISRTELFRNELSLRVVGVQMVASRVFCHAIHAFPHLQMVPFPSLPVPAQKTPGAIHQRHGLSQGMVEKSGGKSKQCLQSLEQLPRWNQRFIDGNNHVIFIQKNGYGHIGNPLLHQFFKRPPRTQDASCRSKQIDHKYIFRIFLNGIIQKIRKERIWYHRG